MTNDAPDEHRPATRDGAIPDTARTSNEHSSNDAGKARTDDTSPATDEHDRPTPATHRQAP